MNVHKPDSPETIEIVQHDNESNLYRFKNSNDDILITHYQVFPGIEIIYSDVHMSCGISNISHKKEHILEIDHCRVGRLECYIADKYFYLAPGDISIHQFGELNCEEIFPTNHYHGITIQIDLDKSPRCLSCFLEDVDVEPATLVKKFHLETNFFFLVRKLPSVEHIFSELYAVPETVKKGYMKVKVLEILLLFSNLEPEQDLLKQSHFSKTQVSLAKDVCRYLTEHLTERITIEQLTKRFAVSATYIKKSFDGVYGISVSTYIRNQRMQAAAKILRETDRTVLDIAGQVGYENGSKFANAFRSVMGVTPTQYRNGNLPIKEEMSNP